MNKLVKRLYLMQLRSNGIPKGEFEGLTNLEKWLLEERGGKYFLKPRFRERIRVVLTGGVFDIIHMGHVVTLREAKKHGDVLVVVVAQDRFIGKKKRKPIHKQKYRKEMVETLKPVDIAVLGLANMKETLRRVGPDVIVYGYDQNMMFEPEGVEVVKLDRKVSPKDIKTSAILKKITRWESG
jgi:cytidyltransferase-like protein